MKRTDLLDIQTCSFFEYTLHLGSVFAYDTDVVSSGFAGPVFLCVKGAELAESVSCKEDLLRRFIRHHYFRPVYHRRKHKRKLMVSKIQSISVFYL